MRLWHQKLIPYLDNKRLLGQHRECCALRGKGWGRKHSVVDYVFKYDLAHLYEYHKLVMHEMTRRNYSVDARWYDKAYRGRVLPPAAMAEIGVYVPLVGPESRWIHLFMIYPEHDNRYLKECLLNLRSKGAELNGEKNTESWLIELDLRGVVQSTNVESTYAKINMPPNCINNTMTLKDVFECSSLDLFAKRRSCRSFRKDKLSDEVLEKIIYAGRLAPSAHGAEDTFTIQIEDPEARKRVEERTSMFMGGFKDPFYGAPHILAVLSLRDTKTGCGAFDGALVLGNMMLAATALGVGSCWINTAQLDTMADDSVLLSLMASRGFRSDAFDGVGYLALGYPASDDFFKQPRKAPLYNNRIVKI